MKSEARHAKAIYIPVAEGSISFQVETQLFDSLMRSWGFLPYIGDLDPLSREVPVEAVGSDLWCGHLEGEAN